MFIEAKDDGGGGDNWTTEPITGGLDAGLCLDVGDGVSLWKVDRSCYLGDMLDVDGDVVRWRRPESGLHGGRFMNICPF